MGKVLEQYKYSKDKILILAIVFSQSVFFQISCAQVNKPPIAAVASPTSQPTDNDIPEPKVKLEDRLTQDELTDTAKLLERYKAATKKDREWALFLLEESNKEFQKGKYTVSGEGFMGSAAHFPTTEALIMTAESIARLNLSDQPAKERLNYQILVFKDSLKFFEAAVDFAKQTSNESELEKYPELAEKTACLKTYLADTNVDASCKFVRDILKNNGIN